MIDIRLFASQDFPDVQAIYQQGIDGGNATFETKVKTEQQWLDSTLAVGRLVAVDENRVVGWASLSSVSARKVYAGIAEVTIYVADNMQGQGIGKKLLIDLIEISESQGFWTLQSAIFPENQASILLHQQLGFRVIGKRENVAQLKGVWRDSILLERRSKVVGVS